MPWGAIQLKPGVDTQLTLSANSAGVSESQLIRYKEGLIQTYGGWVDLAATLSVVRDLHPWQGIGLTQVRLGIGATRGLSVYNSADGSVQVITPQTNTTNSTPNFSISSGSRVLTIVDPGSSASVYDTIFFNTPVAIGGFLLDGAFPVNSVGGSSIYTVLLPSNSTSTVTSSGILPIFATSSGTASITVTLPNNGFSTIPGLFEQFIASTVVGDLTVQGPYQIASVIDSTNFTINALTQSSTTATATMNGGLAQLVYFITLGPPSLGSGFGARGFGSGGFGVGTNNPSPSGTPITATDWTQDNWGENLLACPANGAIYVWSPDSGLSTARVISEAPFFNGGIFVSMPQQILVAWKSTQSSGVQDPLVVRWCNAGDYTNWTVSNQTTAGSFRVPTGSTIVGGIQAPQFGLISTDVDVWTMTYVGGTVTFNFTRVGFGCGWVSSHACGVLSGTPFWMSSNNFFTTGAGGVVPLPCTVWDQVFQTLNASAAYRANIRCAVNSAFNEIAWFFPSTDSETGENDSYVKVHIEGGEYEWDYGFLSRSAWTDVSSLGAPVGAQAGQLYQHETGTLISGVGLPSFRTGWWVIGEGEDIPFVDMIIPDFNYGVRSIGPTASLTITFYGADYPTQTPAIYGPYTVTQSTKFINVRIRHRLLSALIQSSNASEFWRIGRIRFRFARSGRR